MTTVLEPAITADSCNEQRNPRAFISGHQWDKQVTLLMRDYPFDRIMAERVLGQAIAYLITCMECRGQGLGLGPGHLVDIGVHTMILDTAAYAVFCTEYNGGVFLHHVPEIAMKYDGSTQRTAQQIARHGFPVDWPLWEADGGKCTPCRPGEDGH